MMTNVECAFKISHQNQHRGGESTETLSHDQAKTNADLAEDMPSQMNVNE